MVRIAKATLTAPSVFPALPPFPAWARARVLPDTGSDAAFLAGAALAALHPVALGSEPLALLLRKRLALRNAAPIARLEGRKEDEAELRDAWMLRRAGDDPGPGGHILDLWRRLGSRQALSPENWMEIWGGRLGATEAPWDTVLREAEPIGGEGAAIASAAGMAAAVLRKRPEAEALALWLADAVLAIRLKWSAPVPLIATQIRRGELQLAARSSGSDEWLRICCHAYARAAADAYDLNAELMRRADRLLAVAPKLRSRAAPDLVVTLMSEDALAAGSAGAPSDRSGRRFFDRLVALGAVRELTGRPTFRLYGL